MEFKNINEVNFKEFTNLSKFINQYLIPNNVNLEIAGYLGTRYYKKFILPKELKDFLTNVNKEFLEEIDELCYYFLDIFKNEKNDLLKLFSKKLSEISNKVNNVIYVEFLSGQHILNPFH